MILVFGTRLYGQVDKTPGVGSISTEFFHLQYFPIAPLSSYFVSESQYKLPVKTRFNWKSVFVAWARALLLIGFVTGVLFAVLEFNDGNTSSASNAFVVCAMLVCAFEFLRTTHGIGRASKSRAAELRESYGTIQAGQEEGWHSRAA